MLPYVYLRDDVPVGIPTMTKAFKSLPPVQLFDLTSDPSEKKNLADQHPELVKSLAAELATAIRHGRTTPGPDQANDGWPDTIAKPVLNLCPVLQQTE